MSGLFFKYRCEGSRLPSPGGQRMASERVTCRVHGEEADGPLGGVWASVVIITLDYHSDRVFRGNTSSPTDHFARCSSLLSGGGTRLPLRPRLRCPQGCGRYSGKMLSLLSVVLAESTAQVFCLLGFLLFLFFETICLFCKALCSVGEMSKFCPSQWG